MRVGRLEGDYRISQDEEVRPGVRVEVRSSGRGQVPSRGKSPDADPVRLDSELVGTLPHIAQGALGVLQWSGMMVARPQPVLEHKPGDAARVQPLGNVAALLLHG